MAIRKVILANGEIYHILNRGVERRDIFTNKRDYQRFLETVGYYLWHKREKFSNRKRFNKIKLPKKEKPKKLVEIIAYCLMPNHFHFLLKQLSEAGISQFLRKVCDSYAKYFNVKYKRGGPLYQGNFKAVRVTSNEQLIHVSRYIHLNPLVDYLAKKLADYPYSSYTEYLGLRKGLVSPAIVMDQFPKASDYKEFVLSRKDDAFKLAEIKRLLLD